jgi:DNA helicase-4
MELINEVEILNNELKSLENQIKFFKFIKIIGFILYIVIIGHFILQKSNQKLYELNNKKVTLTNSILKKINSLKEHLLKSYNNFLKQDTYLIYSLKEKFLNETNNTLHLLTKISYIIRDLEEFHQNILTQIQTINGLKNDITNYNDKFVKKRKKDYKDLFKTSYGELDEHQQEAIIRDDKYNLVVAGAGAGKTEVLIRRIAYLIKRKPDIIKNNRILAIAFQNKASNEIKERLSKNFNVDVDVRTFHSLGKKILEDSGKKISLIFNGDNFEKEFNNFIKKQYELKLKDKEFKKLLLEYVKYINDDEIEKQEEDFESKEEYVNYNKNLRFTSLNETKVKSEFEREVMNFFLTHKINGKKIEIKYEEKANWLKYTNNNGQEIEVSSDFYFPDFNTYLECWALDKNNKVPNWFEGTNPTEKYINTMNIYIVL